MSVIKFGTDGWRAVIAEGFTFSNLDRVAQATADAQLKTGRVRVLRPGASCIVPCLFASTHSSVRPLPIAQAIADARLRTGRVLVTTPGVGYIAPCLSALTEC